MHLSRYKFYKIFNKVCSFSFYNQTRDYLIYNFYKQTKFMNSQRRFFSKISKAANPKIQKLNQQNENLDIFKQFLSDALNISSKQSTSRPELTQISNNYNYFVNGSLLLNKNNRPSSAISKRRTSTSFIGGSQDNIEKNNKNIQNQIIPISTNGQTKKQSRVMLERPKTSLSQQRDSYSFFVKRYNLAFDQLKDYSSNERLSASRALSKYSIIAKNSAKSLIKLKRDRTIAPELLSARKIVFQFKYKKQSSFAQKMKQNSYAQKILSKNIRYSDKQDYELKGWDYQ